MSFLTLMQNNNGQVRGDYPARIPAELAERIQRETLRIYDILVLKESFVDGLHH